MPRPASDYRGARRNAARGVRKNYELKALRISMGITRRQLDKMRWLARQEKAAN